MEKWVSELVDKKEKDFEKVTDLVINTVRAKSLHRKGGWQLVDEVLDERYVNPHFGISGNSLQKRLNELDDGVTIVILRHMEELERRVNKKLGVRAVECYPQGNHLALRIII